MYLDFRKAFDSVPHYQLLSKLWTTGISGNLWRWFKAYLSSRIQCVSVNSQRSRFLPVLSGVPQGSILGPLLFLIYINDLPLSTSFSTLLLFVDDTKCFKPIRCYTDTCLLQQDLNILTNWSNDWKISFNESKCTLLRFCSSPQTTCQSNYTINHQQLSPTDSHTDLGIVMSADLSWQKHYDLISSRAYKTLGLLRRTFNTTNSVHIKKLLYLSLVRSQLTYCSTIWRPYLHKDILMLEKIQRRATEFILNDYSSDYKSSLVSLRLLPLMMLFELNDIIFFVKSLNCITSSFNILNYVSFCEHGTRSSTYHKLKQSVSCTNKTKHFYFNRLPHLWNSLPTIDLNQPLPTIISELKQFFWNHFIANYNPLNTCTLHYQCPCYKCSVSHSTNFSLLSVFT